MIAYLVSSLGVMTAPLAKTNGCVITTPSLGLDAVSSTTSFLSLRAFITESTIESLRPLNGYGLARRSRTLVLPAPQSNDFVASFGRATVVLVSCLIFWV